MVRLHLFGFLLLSFAASGCHIVDKAQECTALSKVLQRAKDEIDASGKEEPSSAGLSAKAAQYRQLANSIEGLAFSDKPLATQQKELLEQLRLIEKQLEKAAELLKSAEDELRKDVKAQEDSADQEDKVGNVSPPQQEQRHPSDDKKLRDKIRKHGPSPKKSASRRKAESLKRRYSQASHAVQTGNNQIKSIVKRMEDLCRK